MTLPFSGAVSNFLENDAPAEIRDAILGATKNKLLTYVPACTVYYQFCGVVLESEVAFEGKVDELCRELGERGKA